MTRILSRLLIPLAMTVALGCHGPAESDDGDGGDGGNGNDPATWQLVWEDEFEGAAGQLPDPASWGFDVGTDWGNQQLEFDTDRAENVQLDGNGHLAIIAREESYQGQPYTSGRITTADRFEPVYGRVEARIQLPTGQGLWPAFWLLGANIGTVGWPGCGEIDVMEYRGQEPSVVHGSLHGPGYSGADGITARYTLVGDRFDAGFHTFKVEWGPNSIDWYVDDVRYQSVRPTDAPGNWVFNHSFYLILNVAVGGAFVGPPDSSTTFPQTMLVDWVRVYQLKP